MSYLWKNRYAVSGHIQPGELSAAVQLSRQRGQLVPAQVQFHQVRELSYLWRKSFQFVVSHAETLKFS